MMLVHTSGVVVMLLVVLVDMCAARQPFNSSNPDDRKYLLDYYRETNCTMIGLGDHKRYQKLQFYIRNDEMKVHAFGSEECVGGLHPCSGCNGSVSSPSAKAGLGGQGSSSVCSILADMVYQSNISGLINVGYVHRFGEVSNVRLSDLPNGQFGPQATSRTGSKPTRTVLVWNSFADNQLVGPWSSRLRFRADTRGRGVLLTDDCRKDAKKSIEIIVGGNGLELTLRFSNDTQSVENHRCRLDQIGGFSTLMMESEGGFVTVRSGNSPCFRSSGPAVLAKTQCPLFLGGTPMDNSFANDFKGQVESFKFIKGPKDKCMQ